MTQTDPTPPVPRLPDRLRRQMEGPGAARTRPPGTLAEVFADSAVDGGASGFVLAHLAESPGDGPLLWVQDRLSRREAGKPCFNGLPAAIRARDLLYLSVSRPVDVLWALEQGLGGAPLSGVIGEVWGDPQVLDFTASKRIALRAEAQGIPCWLIRRAARPNLSAARDRWRVASLPSLPVEDDLRAPGQPLWRAELFRSRWGTPGSWVVRHDPGGLRMDHGVAADALAHDAAEAGG